MQSSIKTAAIWAVVATAVTAAAAPAAGRVSASFPSAPAAKVSVAKTVSAASAVAALKPNRAPVNTLTKSAVPPAEKQLRERLKYETVNWGGKPVQTLSEASRVLLAQAAAQKAGLHEVGLSFHDLYGIIEAETSWIQRTGASKDGTPNLGLAQFEPRTAAGMGIADPHDPVQAVFGAAKYIKDGAQWAAAKLAGLKLSPQERAAKIREGISVHYNLSVKGRNKWDPRNSEELPVETQRHIRNARAGAAEAAQLARLLKV